MDIQFTEAWYSPKSKQLVLFLCKEPPKPYRIMGLCKLWIMNAFYYQKVSQSEACNALGSATPTMFHKYAVCLSVSNTIKLLVTDASLSVIQLMTETIKQLSTLLFVR